MRQTHGFRVVLASKALAIPAILILAQSRVTADQTEPDHPPPAAGEWQDTNSRSHNHNTNIEWNMENIYQQPIWLYDAYGSWYIPEGSDTMSFHFSKVLSGQDHGDGVNFGHGYIPSSRPVVYQFGASFLDNSPTAALADVNAGFSLWDTAINTDSRPYRKPETYLGFDWRRATLGETADIAVNWWYQDWRSAKSDQFTDKNDNGRYDAGVDTITVDHDGDGEFDTERNFAWVLPRAQPVVEFFQGYWVDDIFYDNDWFFGGTDTPGEGQRDFLTTVLHECGHLVGLDDLYNLEEGDGFEDSLMGYGALGVMRTIDSGSVQGGVDLYTISIPEPSSLIVWSLIGLTFTGIAWRQRRKMP